MHPHSFPQYIGGSYFNDVWVMDLAPFLSGSGASVWVQPELRSPGVSPQPRSLHASAGFTAGGLTGTLLFGGLVSSNGKPSVVGPVEVQLGAMFSDSLLTV